MLCDQTTMTNMFAIDTNMFSCLVDTYMWSAGIYLLHQQMYWSNSRSQRSQVKVLIYLLTAWNANKYICLFQQIFFVYINKFICFHQQIYSSNNDRLLVLMWINICALSIIWQQIYLSNSGVHGLQLSVLMWTNIC